jgi:NitT/TauT family transport system substrate-binding protein
MKERKKVISKGIMGSIIILFIIFSSSFLYASCQDQKDQLIDLKQTMGASLVVDFATFLNPPTLGRIADHYGGGEGADGTLMIALDFKPYDQNEKPIFIGLSPWMGFAPFAVAEKKGFFKDEGINAKIVMFPKKIECYYSFEKGKINFYSADAGDQAVMAAMGYPCTMVMENMWDPKSDKIVIKENLKDLSELKGKKLAAEKTSYSDFYFMVKALEKYGVALNDVEIIDMSGPEATIAFIRGKVDAILTFDPFVTIAIKEGKGKVAAVREEIDKDPIGFAVQNELLKKKPDIVVKVLMAYFRALKWCEKEENEEELYKIANEILFQNTQTREGLERSKSMFKWLKPKEIRKEMREKGPLYQYCQEILDFYYDQGVIDSKPDPNSFINNELYLKAIEAYYEG